MKLEDGAKMVFAPGSTVNMVGPANISGSNGIIEFASGSTTRLSNTADITLDVPATIAGSMTMAGASKLGLTQQANITGDMSFSRDATGSPSVTMAVPPSAGPVLLSGSNFVRTTNDTNSIFTVSSGTMQVTNSNLGAVAMGLGGFTRAASTARRLDLATVNYITLCGSIVGLTNVASGSAVVVDTSCRETSGTNGYPGEYSAATDPATVSSLTIRRGGYLIFKNVAGGGPSRPLLVDSADLILRSGSYLQVWITGTGAFTLPLARYTPTGNGTGCTNTLDTNLLSFDGCPSDHTCALSVLDSSNAAGSCQLQLSVTQDDNDSNSSLWWLLLLALIPLCCCCILLAVCLMRRRKKKNADKQPKAPPHSAPHNNNHSAPYPTDGLYNGYYAAPPYPAYPAANSNSNHSAPYPDYDDSRGGPRYPNPARPGSGGRDPGSARDPYLAPYPHPERQSSPSRRNSQRGYNPRDKGPPMASYPGMAGNTAPASTPSGPGSVR